MSSISEVVVGSTTASGGTTGGTTTGVEAEFKYYADNHMSWNETVNYTDGNITSKSYTDGTDTITVTRNYNADGDRTTTVLSGDVPSGVALKETRTYNANKDITNRSYT